jgi:hypothetical protein
MMIERSAWQCWYCGGYNTASDDFCPACHTPAPWLTRFIRLFTGYVY